jgi:hypothetical protein
MRLPSGSGAFLIPIKKGNHGTKHQKQHAIEHNLLDDQNSRHRLHNVVDDVHGHHREQCDDQTKPDSLTEPRLCFDACVGALVNDGPDARVFPRAVSAVERPACALMLPRERDADSDFCVIAGPVSGPTRFVLRVVLALPRTDSLLRTCALRALGVAAAVGLPLSARRAMSVTWRPRLSLF